MTLTSFAVKYRPVTYVLLLSIMVLGLVAMFTLPRREDPDLQGRWVQIIALYPGATAQQVEELVTDKLERTLLEINDIKVVDSTSRAGISAIEVECADQTKDVKKFRDELRDRIGDLRPHLPAGVLSVDVNDRYSDTAALIVGITKDGATDREREDIARTVRDRLRTFPDVAEVNLTGAQQERLYVELSSQRLSQQGITAGQVIQAISEHNILPASAGSVALGNVRFAIQPTGDLSGVEDLKNLIVLSSGATPIYLKDVAEVKRGYADPSSFIMRVNGKPAVGVTVTMRSGRNITTLGDEVKREFARLIPTLPEGTKLVMLNDLPRSVVGRIDEFKENLVSGIVLIVVVLYLFMGMRSALIVGGMLPVTVLGTFAMMYLFGRDIQQISISALIIALGLVVDNSIVVVDNVERKMSEGMEPEQAAIEGTDELRIPLLTSNLTTVASFAPLILLSGGVGEFIRDMGIVTSLSTLVSLLFNYTIVPLIAIKYLKGKRESRPNIVRRLFLRGVDLLRDGISGIASVGLKHARMTVLLACILLVGTMMLIPHLGTQFFPSAVRNQFTIDVFLPEGRDITATQALTERIDAILRKQTGIESWVTYEGQGGPRFYYNIRMEYPAPNYAQFVVNTQHPGDSPRLVRAIQEEANRTITDARVTVRTLEQGPPVGAPVAVRVTGDSIADIRKVGDQVKSILNDIPGTQSVYQNYDEIPLTLKVDVNEEQARLAGLSATDIAQATQMGFSGVTASYLREGDREIPIDLRLRESERADIQSLEDLRLPTKTGQSVPLRQVGNVRLVPQEAKIVRRNHVRTLTVYSFTDGVHLPSQIMENAKRKIAQIQLPAGVTVGYGGEEAEVEKTFTEMFLILGLTLVANLIVVVWEFNSFRAAWTILAAVPFSMIGAVLGLWVMHLPFGFMAFMGITSLAGVVTNHAIVLFEYALAEQRHGLSLDQALVVAGRKRLRPILLTVLLSVFGVLPQALNGGTLWPPLAWALIYGLLMSLLLTLVIVPAFYKTIGRDESRGLAPVGSVVPGS